MYERIENCPVCNHTKLDNLLIATDHVVSGESFALVKCAKCSFVLTNPRPNTESIPKYYQTSNYISHKKGVQSVLDIIYRTVQVITIRSKTKMIEKYIQSGNILDFGCGVGQFLSAMQNKGFIADGIEINQVAREIASRKINKPLKSSIEDIKGKKIYDVITAWHVLEHVDDINQTLQNLRKKLKKEGYLFVAMPNHKSYDSQYYKEHWAGLDVPRHLSHFSSEVFKQAAKKNKLEVIKLIPMKWDAYYVSYLSEVYKKNKMPFIKGLKTGFKSNQLAKKNNQYSSLIYILKRC